MTILGFGPLFLFFCQPWWSLGKCPGILVGPQLSFLMAMAFHRSVTWRKSHPPAHPNQVFSQAINPPWTIHSLKTHRHAKSWYSPSTVCLEPMGVGPTKSTFLLVLLLWAPGPNPRACCERGVDELLPSSPWDDALLSLILHANTETTSSSEAVDGGACSWRIFLATGSFNRNLRLVLVIAGKRYNGSHIRRGC